MHKNSRICFSQGENSLRSGAAQLCLKPGACRPSLQSWAERRGSACWDTPPGTRWPRSAGRAAWTHPAATHGCRVCQSTPGYHLQDHGICKLRFQNGTVPLFSVTLAGAQEGPQLGQVGQRLEQEWVWKVTAREKPVSINQHELRWRRGSPKAMACPHPKQG